MNEVIEGQDGWLFHGQGSNRWLDYFTGKRTLPEATIHDWINALSEFQAVTRRHRAELLVWIAPEKHTVLSALLPASVKGCSTPFANNLEASPQARALSFLSNSALLAQGVAGAFHSKTDSHFNALGVIHIYRKILDAWGLEKSCTSLGQRLLRIDAAGDLGSKLLPPRSSTTTCFLSSKFSAKPLVQVGVKNLGRVVWSRHCSAPVQEKLLIFGNSFADGDLLLVLAETFREVLFIFFPAPDIEVAKEFGPRYVLFQTNERFISRGPSALGGASFRSFALPKLLVGDVQHRLISGVEAIYPGATVANSLAQAVSHGEWKTVRDLIEIHAQTISPQEATVIALILQKLSSFWMGQDFYKRYEQQFMAAKQVTDYILLSKALGEHESAAARLHAERQ